jgi:hypothetical protein
MTLTTNHRLDCYFPQNHHRTINAGNYHWSIFRPTSVELQVCGHSQIRLALLAVRSSASGARRAPSGPRNSARCCVFLLSGRKTTLLWETCFKCGKFGILPLVHIKKGYQPGQQLILSYQISTTCILRNTRTNPQFRFNNTFNYQCSL